jgi:hypothetical protein
LHEAVWNSRHAGGQADIHSVVKRLRRKLVVLSASATITAVRGVGFRLAECADPGDPAAADPITAPVAGPGGGPAGRSGRADRHRDPVRA